MKLKRLILIAGALALAGCAGIAVAESIKAVSEIAATNAVQNNELTAAQLNTLATDLAALPQTPLPVADNKLIAGIVTEAVKHKAATPTDGAVVDALNGVLNDVVNSHAPTPADGIAWANLQDAVLGMKKAVVLLATSAKKAAGPNAPIMAWDAPNGAMPYYTFSR